MKKITKLAISLGSLSSLFVLPIIAASCTDNRKDDGKKQMNPADPAAPGKPGAPKNPKTSDELFEEHLGIKLSRVAKNQTETDAGEVSDALVKAKDWDDVKKTFKKYGITCVETDEIPDGAKFSVNKSTHPHEDEGLIHLDIDRDVKGEVKTSRFEIKGFKIEAIEDSYTFGNWKLETKSKIEAPIDQVKKAILDAQKQGFEQLIEALKMYVNVEKLDKNDQETQFKFDESNVEEVSDSGQLHFEEVLTYKKSSPENTTPSPTHFVITGLQKS
ncbi:variable surface lipoprotein [Mycoplasma phocoeninasale]|uniref:variable surface lipoprotein n=1 Tax=Mycoplasma phocoeninasale TaxID=2726117 RepID=UPI00196821AD|nr:variable surface lipoprotein [Mycoplasma phocoeninasale]MBN0970813.1 variable surface lipoprotein [Mycoplasma phocoeninasale]